MRLVALAVVVGLCLASCCPSGRGPDERVVALVDDEIATVCSEARCPGSRSSAQIARIDSQEAVLKKRFRASPGAAPP